MTTTAARIATKPLALPTSAMAATVASEATAIARSSEP
jgi:hypothetical protein